MKLIFAKVSCLAAIISVAAASLAYMPAKAEGLHSISGLVTVTAVSDGDTLRSGKLRIRIFGIDAPEAKQMCNDGDGKPWACGMEAKKALADLVAASPALRCDLVDVDRYGRLIMRCYAGKDDIGASMVRTGNALAYRRYAEDYVGDEDAARRAKTGLWAGTFQPPWAWRRSR